MALDPWSSVNSRIDESKAALLKATAQGGSAGRKAFEEAQAGINANRQAAVGHALNQSMNLTGRDIGTDNVTGMYDSRLGALASAKSGFESGIAGTEASGVSYLEKVRATMPVLQEQNKAKLDTREGEIKRAIELAKAAAEADAAEKAAAEQRIIDRENRAEERSIARENRASAKSAVPSLAELQGLASQQLTAAPIYRDTGNILGAIDSPEGRAIRDAQTPGLVSNLAHTLGTALGVGPTKLAGLFAPGQQASLVSAIKKLNPPAKADPVVKQLATLTRLSERDVSTALSDPDYKKQFNNVKQLLAAGVSWQEVDAALRADLLPKKTRSYAVLQEQFRDLFSSAGLLKPVE